MGLVLFTCGAQWKLAPNKSYSLPVPRGLIAREELSPGNTTSIMPQKRAAQGRCRDGQWPAARLKANFNRVIQAGPAILNSTTSYKTPATSDYCFRAFITPSERHPSYQGNSLGGRPGGCMVAFSGVNRGDLWGGKKN